MSRRLARVLLLGWVPLLFCSAGELIARSFPVSLKGPERLFGAVGGLVPFLAALSLPLATEWLKNRVEGLGAEFLLSVAILVLLFPCSVAAVIAMIAIRQKTIVSLPVVGGLAIVEMVALVIYYRWLLRE